MKKEYNFSKAVRGKFYRAKVKLNLPIYLESEAFKFIVRIAKNRHQDVSTVANELIKSDMRLVQFLR